MPAPRLTVLGTGYLGATHAVCMAELGFEVLGLDVDESKVARLNAGDVPFFEPGLPELLRKNLETGRLRFTTSMEEVGAFGDVHFLCVGTPQKPGEMAADMQYVDAAFRALLPHLQPDALVVGKSTVPAGTAERLTALLEAGQREGTVAAGRRAGLEPGVPAGGLRRRRHAHAGPAGLRRAPRAGPRRSCGRPSRRSSTDRRRSSSPTSRPPSWSRSPPTRSSPPRSRSSTPWRRSARSPAAT